MDAADVLILAFVACLDGILLVWLRYRRRLRRRDAKMSRVLRRGLHQLARA